MSTTASKSVSVPIPVCASPARDDLRAETAYARGMEVEARALEYLLRVPGMSLVERNYRAKSRTNRAEIDLVMIERSGGGESRSRCELVFVEVRSRVPRGGPPIISSPLRPKSSSGRWPGAEASVDGWKKRCLRRAIEHYLHGRRLRLPRELTGMRVDLVAWDGVRFRWFRAIDLSIGS